MIFSQGTSTTEALVNVEAQAAGDHEFGQLLTSAGDILRTMKGENGSN